ncbi:hypothetical protein EGJ27_05720 [Pseudomonas sp. v388]|nr:hypothetical protein EGJ27_05720 [Pseudomonas sp. v388]
MTCGRQLAGDCSVSVTDARAGMSQSRASSLPRGADNQRCSLCGVTRNTSSSVVRPAETFCAPDRRRLRMPSLKA